MTKGRFKELNHKLDSILLHRETFCTSKRENLLSTHLATVELLTSENGEVHEEIRKIAPNSAKRISEATKNFEKLLTEVQEFMNDFRTSSYKSVADMNKAIKGFSISF